MENTKNNLEHTSACLFRLGLEGGIEGGIGEWRSTMLAARLVLGMAEPNLLAALKGRAMGDGGCSFYTQKPYARLLPFPSDPWGRI